MSSKLIRPLLVMTVLLATSRADALNVLLLTHFAANSGGVPSGPIYYPSDQAMANRLTNTFGATVKIVSSTNLSDVIDNVPTSQLVIVSGTTAANEAGVTYLGNQDVPLINMEYDAFSTYHMQTNPKGDKGAQTQTSSGLVIQNISSPLTAGLAPGNVAVYNNVGEWNRAGGNLDLDPGSTAIIAATTISGDGVTGTARPAVWGYDRDATSGQLVFPDGFTGITKRRSGLFVGDNLSEGFFMTEAGTKLFDATVAWTAEIPVPAGVLPGDTDANGKAQFADYKTWKTNYDTKNGYTVFNFGSGGEKVGNFDYDNLVTTADRDIWKSHWLIGDINDDNSVGTADVNQVVANWHGAGPNGDASLNNFVDIFDVAEIAQHWTGPGSGSGLGGSSAVPEPGSAGLLVIGLLFMIGAVCFRRERQLVPARARCMSAALAVVALSMSTTPAKAINVLFISGSGDHSLQSPGEMALINRMRNNLGATVTVMDDATAPGSVPLSQSDYITAAGGPSTLVVISRNVGDTNPGSLAFVDQGNPVLLLNEHLLNEYRFTALGSGDGNDDFSTQMKLTTYGAAHTEFGTAGLTAATAFDFNSTTGLQIGYTASASALPAADAHLIAYKADKLESDGRYGYFAYDAGSTMQGYIGPGGVTTARHTFLGIHEKAEPLFLTPAAWRMFDAAVTWTATIPGSGASLASTVPEPSTLCLLLGAACYGSVRRRRRS